MRLLASVAEGKAVAHKQSYLQLMSIATEAIGEYTAGDKTYLLSLQQTSPLERPASKF